MFKRKKRVNSTSKTIVALKIMYDVTALALFSALFILNYFMSINVTVLAIILLAEIIYFVDIIFVKKLFRS